MVQFKMRWPDVKYRDFHLMLYQANFASHHTRDSHVDFLFASDGIGKRNKMFHYFLFNSYHIIRLQPNDKNISTNTWLKFQILSSSQKFKRFLLLSSKPLYTKGNQEMLQNYLCVSENRIIQTLY